MKEPLKHLSVAPSRVAVSCEDLTAILLADGVVPAAPSLPAYKQENNE